MNKKDIIKKSALWTILILPFGYLGGAITFTIYQFSSSLFISNGKFDVYEAVNFYLLGLLVAGMLYLISLIPWLLLLSLWIYLNRRFRELDKNMIALSSFLFICSFIFGHILLHQYKVMPVYDYLNQFFIVGFVGAFTGTLLPRLFFNILKPGSFSFIYNKQIHREIE